MNRRTVRDFYYNYDFPHEVDEEGRVFSPRGFELKPQVTKNGYLRVSLSHKGNKKNFKVHRLVAMAFLPNERNKIVFGQVDHIDGDKINNHVSNLRWVSAFENAYYRRQRESKLQMQGGTK